MSITKRLRRALSQGEDTVVVHKKELTVLLDALEDAKAVTTKYSTKTQYETAFRNLRNSMDLVERTP